MKYHYCPVCEKKGYYKSAKELWYEMGWIIQNAPRCKFCYYYLPFNGQFQFLEKDDPWKHNWINANRSQMVHPMDGEKDDGGRGQIDVDGR